VNTTAPELAKAARRSAPPPPVAPRPRSSAWTDHRTWTETLVELAAIIDAPAYFGPPVIFVIGPWLLIVLVLIGPIVLLITFVLVGMVAAGLLVAIGAVVASPYLLVRHLRARNAGRRHRAVLLRRPTGAARASITTSPATQAKGTT
jgi:hypothetical protein